MSTPNVEIINLSPNLQTHRTLYMLEHFGATLTLASVEPPAHFIVQLWTNLRDKFNSEGQWHSINLDFTGKDTQEHYLYSGSVMPTSQGDYQFTYRIRHQDHPEQWQWVGGFQENGRLHIEPPSPDMHWTQKAHCVEVYPQVYVGNFIAASQAEALEIDAVLNLAEELTLTFPETSDIAYKKLGLLDGAQHAIAHEALLEAIQWIDEQRQQGKRKILVHCRAGIGRSGSVGVAYCFSQFSHLSYGETLAEIWRKKPDIYPHSGLQNSLEMLFPRSLK
jgi:protein-tyrosine phosphatase